MNYDQAKKRFVKYMSSLNPDSYEKMAFWLLGVDDFESFVKSFVKKTLNSPTPLIKRRVIWLVEVSNLPR